MQEALKNTYSKEYIEKLAMHLAMHDTKFLERDFVKFVIDKDWEARELKSRMMHISDGMHQFLTHRFTARAEILCEIAPQFSGYHGMFLPHYIQTHGTTNWKTSMKALARMTPYASAEFAVRIFIQLDEDRMMQQMRRWSESSNLHLRRLASEGCRPRLPWATALAGFKKNPRPVLPILEQLKNDPSLYVRKSVANNLNDISKDNPDIALDIIRLWSLCAHKEDAPGQLWVIKHGARTLLKSANPVALHLFKLPKPRNISVNKFICTPVVKIGKQLDYAFEMKNTKDKALGNLRIEYCIGYPKLSGRISKKKFKITERFFLEEEKYFSGSQSFAQMTTRKHYCGEHQFSIVVNGENLYSTTFQVKE